MVALDYASGPNKRSLVAGPLISMVDFAHTYKDETLPVPVYIDDEGVRARDIWLIKDPDRPKSIALSCPRHNVAYVPRHTKRINPTVLVCDCPSMDV